ncbi:ATP-binding protein [Variovorax sp. ZS18.2.2]|uniref:ATP-binding protein n=1 Tax=Variovorax sp. ZS18.2.2 TaxID=2971255 RepID=UPI0021509990|nr:ATP-binding protein [Variovorax sp. ZS18.2.2]MCR6477756.1 ATP-binding protein [Variovorax sp. ZS18.2.2]
MYSGNLGLVIATGILLGLAGVVAMMGSLLIANIRAGTRARDVAEQARSDARQKMLASSVQDLRPLIGATPDAADIRFDIQLPSEAVHVFAIKAELCELLAKVAAHAARVMSAGATLQVSARVECGHAVVHWRDLDADDVRPPLARFFDALDAASQASARVCERIASSHGGRIYSAPHADGALGLTLRLPLHGAVAGA